MVDTGHMVLVHSAVENAQEEHAVVAEAGNWHMVVVVEDS